MPSLVIPQRLQLKGEFSNWSAKPLEGEDRQKEGHKTSLRWWLWSCECTGCSSSSKHWCCHIPSSTPAVPSSVFWRKSHPSMDLWNEEAQCDRMVRSCLLKAAAPAISRLLGSGTGHLEGLALLEGFCFTLSPPFPSPSSVRKGKSAAAMKGVSGHRRKQ